MVETFFPARNGSPIAAVDGVLVHSSFDPENEALRYLRSLTVKESPELVVVLCSCMGYLARAAAEVFPGARILLVDASPAFATRRIFGGDDSWSPGDSRYGGAGAFLEATVNDGEAGAAIVLSWPAGCAAYGEAAVSLAAELRGALRRMAANQATAFTFAGRWIRNVGRLCAFSRRTATFAIAAAVPRKVLIVAPGPSLEAALPSIAERRQELFLVAASSAAEALAAQGITPDLAVSTDGGFWAGEHLRLTVRDRGALALAAHGYLPAGAALPLLVVDDASSWQRLMLGAASIPSISLPTRGTVSATAIDLAFALGAERVFLVGVDFGASSSRLHARPYALDRYHMDGTTRLRPAERADYEHSAWRRGAVAFDVYREWFAARPEAWRRRVGFVGPDGGRVPEGYGRYESVACAALEGPDDRAGPLFRSAQEPGLVSAGVDGNPYEPLAGALRRAMAQARARCAAGHSPLPELGAEGLPSDLRCFVELSELLAPDALSRCRGEEAFGGPCQALESLGETLLERIDGFARSLSGVFET